MTDATPPLAVHGMPGHLIRRLQQMATAVFTREAQAAGIDLTPIQFAALSAIAARPGMDQAGLAATISHDRVTIGGVVDRLVAKGLIHRAVSDRDRRARVLRITEAGAQQMDRITAVAERAQQAILANLDAEERAVFIALMHKALDGTG